VDNLLNIYIFKIYPSLAAALDLFVEVVLLPSPMVEKMAKMEPNSL